MRQHEIRDAIRKQPFQPFRIHLSNGQVFDIRHPEFALLTRSSVHVVVPETDNGEFDHVIQCDLIHVVAMEQINGAGS